MSTCPPDRTPSPHHTQRPAQTPSDPAGTSTRWTSRHWPRNRRSTRWNLVDISDGHPGGNPLPMSTPADITHRHILAGSTGKATTTPAERPGRRPDPPATLLGAPTD